MTPSSSPRSPQDDDKEESREGEQKDGAMTNHREPKEGVRSPGKQQQRRLYPPMIRKGKSSKKDVMPKAGNDGSLIEPNKDNARSEADDESLAASNAKAESPERNTVERARSRWSPRRLMRRGHMHEKAYTNSHQTVDYGVKEKKPPLWVRSGTVHWVKAGSEQSGISDAPTGQPDNTSLAEHQLSNECSTNPALDGTQSTGPIARDDLAAHVNPLLAQSEAGSEEKAWHLIESSQRQEIFSSDYSHAMEMVFFDTTKENDGPVEPPPTISLRTTEISNVADTPKPPTTKSVRFSDEVSVLGYGNHEGAVDVLPMSLCLGAWVGDITESDTSGDVTVVDMTSDSFSEFSVGIALLSNQPDYTNLSENMPDQDVAMLPNLHARGRMSPLSLDDCPASHVEESFASVTESIDLAAINSTVFVGEVGPSSEDYPISRRGKMWVKIVDFVPSLVAVIVYALIVAQKLPCIGHAIFVVGVKVKVAGAFALCCFSCLFTRDRQQRRIRRSKLEGLIFSRKMFLLLIYLAIWNCFVNLAMPPFG